MTLREIEKKLVELENRRAEINTQIAELNAQREYSHPLRWKPNIGEQYWSIIKSCTPQSFTWENDGFDNECYKLGNLFRSEKDSEFEIERRKVFAEMQEWAGNSCDGVYMYYQRPTDEILYACNGAYCFGNIRFKSFIDAENCVKTVGKERIKKYYFMVPEES